MGWGINAGLLRYGPEWRSHRRIYQQAFKPESSLNYRLIQAKKIRDFLNVIMSAMYDHDVALKDDFFVQVSEAAVSRLAYLIVPGATVVNMFPILRFIPSWFPGVGFKRFCSETQKLVEQMRNAPLASMEAKMREGKAPNCIVADLFENCKSEEERVKIGDVAGTSFAAAADTKSKLRPKEG
ncbi:hypothetical protein BDN70DRAFT_584543 [Pholiota conissans]|uniref:Cytochrome P450 n=1 Tax=Pholiota conissans TaxID=109636 RepID=A0A9P5Z3H2_9AGAR|nr:hypothetical protein BDN70DRAFT_584543 [Pholiota conissans]